MELEKNKTYLLLKSFSIKDNIIFDGGNSYIKTSENGEYDSGGSVISLGELSSEFTGTIYSNIILMNLKYDGNSHSVSVPFQISGGSSCLIMNCEIRNAIGGFRVRRGGFNNKIYRCRTFNLKYQCVSTGGKDDEIDLTNGITVSECYADGGSLAFDLRSLTRSIVVNNVVKNHSSFLKVQEIGSATVNNNYVELDEESLDTYYGIKIDSDNFIIRDNIIRSSGNCPLIYFNTNTENSHICGNILHLDNIDLTNAIRFDNGTHKNVVFTNNVLSGNQSKYYMLKIESDATLENSKIVNNIFKSPAVNSSGESRSVMYIKNITNVEICNNLFELNNDPDYSKDEKGILAGADVYNCTIDGNQMIGTGTMCIDVRSSTFTESRICNNMLVSTISDSATLQVSEDNNNIVFFNKINGTYTDLTPTLATSD